MVSTSSTIHVQINGETHSLTSSMALVELLEGIGMNPRLVAVEYNGEILHRQHWATTQIQNGDTLEVVTIVGGG